MTPQGRRFARETGFSMIELMVAMTIGLVLLGVITYSYVGTKQTFRTQEALSRKNENGRVALETIVRDLREAARLGCKRAGAQKHDAIVRVIADFPIMEDSPAAFHAAGMFRPGVANIHADVFVRPDYPAAIGELNTGLLIRSFESGAGFTVPSGGKYLPIANTDVLQIMKTAESGSHLKNAMTSTTDDILLADEIPGAKPSSGSSVERLFVLGDCESAELLKANINSSSAADGGKLAYSGLNAATPDLLKKYGKDAWVSPFEPAIYLIARPSAASQVTTPFLVRYTLVQSNSSPPVGRWDKEPAIVADGIEDLQIRFGVDDPLLGLRYFDGSAAGFDWSKVVTAEISIVVVSEADRVTATKSSTTSGGADSRLRQRLTAVVQLRNRQI